MQFFEQINQILLEFDVSPEAVYSVFAFGVARGLQRRLRRAG